MFFRTSTTCWSSILLIWLLLQRVREQLNIVSLTTRHSKSVDLVRLSLFFPGFKTNLAGGSRECELFVSCVQYLLSFPRGAQYWYDVCRVCEAATCNLEKSVEGKQWSFGCWKLPRTPALRANWSMLSFSNCLILKLTKLFENSYTGVLRHDH